MEKIWLKNYQAGVLPGINPDTYSSLVHLFEDCCEKFADKNAYANMGTALTFRQLQEYSRQFASYLQNDLHLTPGSRVAIMMPNCLQYPIVLFGILQAGMTVVNVNPLYTASELTHQLNDAQADTLIVLANFAKTVSAALPQMTLKHIIITELGDLFPIIKRTLVNFVIKHIKKMVPDDKLPYSVSFKHVLQTGKHSTFQPVKVNGQDIAFLQYTGGTTGIAKAAMLTHRNMVANVMQAAAWCKPILIPGEEILITAIPLYHIFSLTANCLVFLLYGSLNILITNPKDASNFVKEISKSKFTVITGVSTLFNLLLHHPDFAKVDFSHLKLSLAGGMALQRAVADKWHEITGNTIIEAYGLTEACPAVTINPFNLNKYNGSIGLPLPSTDISIRDHNNRELGINEEGILWIKGPQVMLGYWQKPNETKQVLTTDGWLNTGDIVKIDDNGYLYLVDREKDMIVVSGFNVYPNEVEQVISMHPGVLEVGVIGVPYEATGERVKACIVKKDPNLTAEEIIRYCHEYLTHYKVPKIIEFRSELPKTNVGKILRRALHEPTP